MPVDQERVSSVFQKVGRQLNKAASKPLPETVHQFRTATRRMEAVLEELVPEPDRNQRKLLKQLSRLRRRAGQIRDLDVQIVALRGLKAAQEPALKAEVLQSLVETRTKREAKLLEALDKETVRKVHRRLKRTAQDLEISQSDPFALATRMLNRLTRMPGPVGEQLLHQYRIKGKRVRYIAELAGDTPEAQRLVEQLKRMQDALGEWHDWLTLTQTVQQHVGPQGRSPLLAELNSITRAKFRAAIEVVQETKTQAGAKPVLLARPAAVRRKPAAAQGQATAAIA